MKAESLQSSTARNGKSTHRSASSATAPRTVLKRPKKLQPPPGANSTAQTEHGDPYQLQGLDRVVAILDLLGASDNSLSLAEICQRMGLHKSTAHRALMALERTGMIERAPASRYRLGLKLYDMGSRAVEQIDLRSRVHPHLRKLALRVGETVHLGVLHKTRVVYIDKVEPMIPIGGSASAPRTGTSEIPSTALLLWQGDTGLSPCGGGRKDCCENSIQRIYLEDTCVSRRTSREHWNAYGVADTRSTMKRWKSARAVVGASILDAAGRPIAAVSISGSATRLAAHCVPAIAQHVIRCSQEISSALRADADAGRARQ